jgi:FkbM family methyltransferase
MVKKAIQRFISLAIPEMKYATLNFSQEGEELILKRYFNNRKKGFYVDVGAHHPFKFSNTYSFYKKGWNGINIDPLPGIMSQFKKYRRRDINLETGISKKQEQLTYYKFNEPAVNTFSTIIGEQIKENGTYQFLGTQVINTFPLKDILEQHIPNGPAIDFLTIDAEGFDLEVLESNDWNRFRPELVVVESHDFDIQHPDNHPIYQFLLSKNYQLFAKTFYTVFFKKG